MAGIWQLVATERTRLFDALVELDDADWDKPSLCTDWNNKQTLAHIVFTAEITRPVFFIGMAKNGMRFHRMSANNVRKVSVEATDDLLARLRAAIPSHNRPPGPVGTVLMETVVHGEDIAYALGKKIDHTEEGLIGAADFAKGAQPLVGCRKRIAGLSLRATDVDWSTGDGPEVSGPLVALLLAMSGRKPALDALTGEGVTTLRVRA